MIKILSKWSQSRKSGNMLEDNKKEHKWKYNIHHHTFIMLIKTKRKACALFIVWIKEWNRFLLWLEADGFYLLLDYGWIPFKRSLLWIEGICEEKDTDNLEFLYSSKPFYFHADNNFHVSSSHDILCLKQKYNKVSIAFRVHISIGWAILISTIRASFSSDESYVTWYF